ncbi:MAG: hypothetical protein HF314_12155 [Ignavibacteria bacterium]|jgi:hypothetical protein|nr:hypothetical protein [Ignavibacteria bacterium]MCU7503824.1 hypothetical protein [Ignavibacteria bacterium]MCU7517162.1 hypothetical protein [Ignavibacteria bacterium]
MTDLILSIVTVIYLLSIVGFVIFLYWVILELLRAPMGYEDENGFHLGTENEEKYE